MQKLWLVSISWDEHPREEVAHVCHMLCDQLSELKELQIPRFLVCDNVKTYELHGFCNSSELAYGAVIYLRTVCNDESILIRLSCAKARVVSKRFRYHVWSFVNRLNQTRS